jgi:hypothetical protein
MASLQALRLTRMSGFYLLINERGRENTEMTAKILK